MDSHRNILSLDNMVDKESKLFVVRHPVIRHNRVAILLTGSRSILRLCTTKVEGIRRILDSSTLQATGHRSLGRILRIRTILNIVHPRRASSLHSRHNGASNNIILLNTSKVGQADQEGGRVLHNNGSRSKTNNDHRHGRKVDLARIQTIHGSTLDSEQTAISDRIDIDLCHRYHSRFPFVDTQIFCVFSIGCRTDVVVDTYIYSVNEIPYILQIDKPTQ
jgi:hypothetical protein